jgi:peroxiredoxin Q/BCP
MGVQANVGDVAPDFTLRGAGGVETKLSSLRGSKRALLVFYPQDMTSGCTDQLKAIQEVLGDFEAADIQPFGVNDGDAASHQQFIDELDLTFELLVDEGLKVAGDYEALRPEGNRILRTVVMVGKDGKVIYRAQGAPAPAELLATISSASDE